MGGINGRMVFYKFGLLKLVVERMFLALLWREIAVGRHGDSVALALLSCTFVAWPAYCINAISQLWLWTICVVTVVGSNQLDLASHQFIIIVVIMCSN